ncbi:MAG: hypothetical protein V2B15_01260 [Bacteroidota bacterium]
MKGFIFFMVSSLSALGIHGCQRIPEGNGFITRRIEVGPGPEDMVLDSLQGLPRLLISCTGRRELQQPYGEIESLDLVTGRRKVLSRQNEPAGLKFRPHGIFLDDSLLYVISHEEEPDHHPILIYRVSGDTLEFMEWIQTPAQHSPNALVAGPGGEIYFVNDSGKRGSLAEKILKLRRASLVRLTRGTDNQWESQIIASNLGYPAGINRIGNQIYAGDAILHRIHIFNITSQGVVPGSPIRGLKGNDNIRIHNGRILTPGHINALRFIRHAKDPRKLSPVEVFLADPQTGDVRSIYMTDGSEISAGSTAILFDGYLYIGQVFDPYILKIKMEDPLFTE